MTGGRAARILPPLFFLLLFLASCGIPNYFYLTGNYLNFVSVERVAGASGVAYDCSFEVTDPQQLAKCRDCPSVLLLYLLDTDYVVSNKSTVVSKFNSEYNSVNVKGVLASVDEGTLKPMIEQYVPTGYESLKVSLYALNFADGSPISRPGYHVSVPVGADSSPETSQVEFAVRYDRNAKKLYLSYPEHAGDDTSLWIEKELVRGNGKGFSELPSDDSAMSGYKDQNADCLSIGDMAAGTRLHVFAAFCASNGTFDNIYWSQLQEVANITL